MQTISSSDPQMIIQIESLKIPIRKFEDGCPNPDTGLNTIIAEFCNVTINDIITYDILQKSIDARQKNNICFVYKLIVELRKSPSNIDGIKPFAVPDNRHFIDNLIPKNVPKNPIIVGTGPAGLSAAYLLALYGCDPIILDRGYNIEQREIDIDNFLTSRSLNPESNYILGEGGAGTYSDGKLYTRTKDSNIKFILDLFAANGAPPEIKYLKKPHIGSDILPVMVKNMRQKIESLGGQFIWGAEITDIIIADDCCQGVITSTGETFEAPLVIIASGHSARKLIKNLTLKVEYSLKDFQIGCRIEHLQSFINHMQYGTTEPPEFLGAAEYNLVSRPPVKTGACNTTTFCMCPGGDIIPATSDPGLLSTNGMSCYARKGKYANSGLIVNQKKDTFSSPAEAYEFIENIESTAFERGGSDYTAPAQGAYAFALGESGLPRSESSYSFGIRSTRLDEIFPRDTYRAIREALAFFKKNHPGFAASGTLIGVETRVSSPIRFMRNSESLMSSINGLYLAGEGAGFASGIISAALDGLRISEKILSDKH